MARFFSDPTLPRPIAINGARNRRYPAAELFRTLAHRTNAIVTNRSLYCGSFSYNRNADDNAAIELIEATRFRSGWGPELEFVVDIWTDASRPKLDANSASVDLFVIENNVLTHTDKATRNDRRDPTGLIKPPDLQRFRGVYSIAKNADIELQVGFPAETGLAYGVMYVQSGVFLNDAVFGEGVREAEIGQVGEPIRAEQMRNLLRMHRTLLRRNNGGVIAHWVGKPHSPPNTTSTTYVNVMDTAFGTGSMSANSPGFTVDLLYRNLLGASQVPVRLNVYGEQSDGFGEVALFETGTPGSPAISVSGIGARNWYSATGLLNPLKLKYDPLMRLTSASANDLEVWCMTLEVFYP